MAVGLRAQVKSAPINASAAGDNTIVAAVAGKQITVVGLLLMNNVATAQTVTVKDGAATALSGPLALSTAGSPLFMPERPDFEYFSTSNVTNNLVLNLSAATQVGGVVWYIQW